jgi:hypothetical protein
MKKFLTKLTLPKGLIKEVVISLAKKNIDKLDLVDKTLDVVLSRLPFPQRLFALAFEDVLIQLIKHEVENAK